MGDRYCSATWYVSHSPTPTSDETWRLLQSMLLVNWSWDLFIWDLRELLHLLTTTPGEFNYLFVTTFLGARAAYLAVTSRFNCTQQEVICGIGARRVQFVTIYYRLLLATLREVLGSEKGAQMIGDREERLFQLAIREAERRYVEILEVIAVAPDLEGDLHGHDIESWVTGTELRYGKRVCVIPRPVQVRVMTERYGRHRLVRPCAKDMVRKIMKREAFRSFLQRVGDANRTDIEIEKLSRFSKVHGHEVVKYGDLVVQYYATLTNTAKTTLYVVCADRTMRLHQRNGVPPGPRPRMIEVWEGAETREDLYVVTFDSGAVGVYAIDFRPHKENEQERVPSDVRRVPRHFVRRHEAGELPADGVAPLTGSDLQVVEVGLVVTGAGVGLGPAASADGAEAEPAAADGGAGEPLEPQGGTAAVAVVAVEHGAADGGSGANALPSAGDVCGGDSTVTSAAAVAGSLMPPPAPDAPAAGAVAASGKRFEISGDFSRVVDKVRNRTYAVEFLNARLALQVFVECKIDKAHKRTVEFIRGEVIKKRALAGRGEIGDQPMIHLFRNPKAKGGRRRPYGFYGALVRSEPRMGFYWLEL